MRLLQIHKVFSDGARNEPGNVAVSGNSLAVRQLRQKCDITHLSDYQYYYAIHN